VSARAEVLVNYYCIGSAQYIPLCSVDDFSCVDVLSLYHLYCTSIIIFAGAKSVSWLLQVLSLFLGYCRC
jgi:hypothetical protein